jgi:hypothetical protein
VISVSPTGLVTPLSIGNCLVTVTTVEGHFQASCVVYVSGVTTPGGSSGRSQSSVVITTPVNGKVTVNPSNPANGTKVTVTVTPDEGYELDKLTITDAGGKDVPFTDNGDGTFTYTQPDSRVTITATFKAAAPTPITPALPVNPFEDVKGTDWFIDDVIYVHANGLMVGTSEKPMLFSPQATLTRGMGVTVLYRIAGSPAVSGLANPFDDVPEGRWYTDAVKWAAANGIAAGYGNGKFGTEDNITREQMAVMIVNYEQFSGKIPPDILMDREFSDWNDISGWAKDAVNRLTMQGIINGKPNNLFDPGGNATRAESAAMLHRFLEASS